MAPLMDRVLFSVTARKLWAAGSLVGLVASILIDHNIRQLEDEFPSVSTLELWLSIAYGFALGWIGVFVEQRNLRVDEPFMLEFHRSAWRERLTWRLQSKNWRRMWWFMALYMVIPLWAVVRMAQGRLLFIFPALLAAGIPFGLLATERVRLFAAKLRDEATVSPTPE